MKKVLLIFFVLGGFVFFVTEILMAQTGQAQQSKGSSLHAPAGSIHAPAVSDQKESLAGDDDAYEPDAYEDEYTEGEEAVVVIADPLKHWNILMYHFNDKLYFWVLKPVSQGYAYVTPELVRKGIWNFFSNLEASVIFVNCLLQGKGTDAEATFARFLVNTTIGFAGFGDPASDFPMLKKVDEDLGQTFGYWGIDEGWYLTLPLFGPSTIRDATGMGGDSFLKPTYYIKAIEATIAMSTLETINSTSFRIGDYETIKAAALDPYEAIRDGYLQYRKSKVMQ